MTALNFTFSFSDKYLDEQFVETGVRPDKYEEIEIDATKLTKEARKAYVELGAKTISLGTLDKYPSEEEISALLVSMVEKEKAEAKAKIDEAIVYIQELEAMDESAIAAHRVYHPEEGTLKKEYPEWGKRLDAQRQRSQNASVAIREAKAAAEKAAKEAAEKERLDWINQHGSDHLKKAVAAGYNCKRLYVTERVNLEYPEFQADIDNKAEWKSRSCPSHEALEFSLRHPGSEVVWCTRRHDYKVPEPGYYDNEDEPAQEAVVIKDYLGDEDLDLIHYV